MFVQGILVGFGVGLVLVVLLSRLARREQEELRDQIAQLQTLLIQTPFGELD